MIVPKKIRALVKMSKVETLREEMYSSRVDNGL